MLFIYVYPIIPAVIIGTLSWLYWKKQGYSSTVLGYGIIVGYVISHYIFKYFA